MAGPPPPPPPPARGRRGWLVGRGAGWTFAALIPLLALGALLAWLAATPAGLGAGMQLALRLGEGRLAVDGAEGRLLGPLRIARLAWDDGDLRLEVRGLAVDWRPAALLAGRLAIERLEAERLGLASAPSPAPRAPPASLVLPLAVGVERFAVARLAVEDWAAPAAPPVLALTDLAGSLASDGRRHRVRALSVRTPVGVVSLEGTLDAASPFALAARLALAGERNGQAYRLAGEAGGELLAPVITFTGSGAGLAGEGRLLAAPFAPVPLRELRLALGEVDPAAFDPALPSAALHLAATLAPDAEGALAGPLRIGNRRPRPVDQGGLPVETLAGRLRWQAGELALTGLELALPGAGRVTGGARWEARAGRGEARLALQGVDLARLHGELPATRLAGPLFLQGGAAAQRVEAELADARFRLSLKAGQEGGAVAVETLQLAAGAGSLAASGRAALTGERAFAFSGRLARFDPRAVWPRAPAGEINLSFEAAGRLAPAPAGQFAFRLAGSRLAGRSLAGEGALALAAGGLTVSRLGLDLAGNRLAAAGALGQPGDSLTVEVDAPRLEALGAGPGGRLTLRARLAGALRDPAAELTAAGQYLVWPGVLRVGGVNLQGRLAPGPEGAVSLVLGASRLGPPGAAGNWADRLVLQLAGTRRDHTLTVAAGAGRREHWQATLEGGLADGGWRGRLREVAGQGAWAMALEAPAALQVGVGAASLGAATLRVGEGVVHLRETRWSPAATVLRGELSGLGFGLVATDGGPLRRGQPTLRLGAEWDLRLTDRFDGEARLFRESGDLVLIGDRPARLGLEAFEVVFSARSNRLAASLQARGGQLGELAAAATAAADKGPAGWRLAPDGALLGAARLAMPSIAWLGPLAHPGLVTEGRLEAEFSLAGTPARPLARGQLRGSGLGFSLGELGLRLSGGSLLADFERDQLRLATLEFLTPVEGRPRDRRLQLDELAAEPGRLTASGAVDLASGAGRFDFVATRLAILQRPEQWLMVSGAGEARSSWSSLDLTARLQADAGFIGLAASPAPSLSDDVVVLGRGEEGGAGPFRINLDASLDLGPRLYLSVLGLDSRLAGALRLRRRDGQPLVTTGTVSTVGGVYEGYGQKLAIERGRVSFSGPADNPSLDVVALRKGLEVEAGVAITGTARRPQVRLVSEPNVPDQEKLAWIVLGRPSDTAGGADLALLIPAAQALLGGPGGGMTRPLATALGLDEISIGQGARSPGRGAASRVVGSAVGHGGVSGQVLSVGKRLSADAVLSLEQGLASAESVVKLTYQLTRRLALVARGGTDNAVDLTYTLSFR